MGNIIQKADIEEAGNQVKSIRNDFSHDVAKDKPLWLEIVRYLNTDDLNLIGDMPDLKGMIPLVQAEQETVKTLKYIQRESMIKRKRDGVGNPIGQLDVEYNMSDPNLADEIEIKKDFWCSWSTQRKAGFGSQRKFRDFCMYAGVDPSSCIPWNTGRGQPGYFYFLSTDKKVIFICSRDPRCSYEAYVHDGFTMIGRRERVKWLDAWFHANIYWGKQTVDLDLFFPHM